MIIALGESIVAIGIGAAGIELDPTVVIAAVLGLVARLRALVGVLRHRRALVARKKLIEARGHDRARLARDAYSYLHLPMFAGIVLVALGAKKVLAHVDEPLATVPAVRALRGRGPLPFQPRSDPLPERAEPSTRVAAWLRPSARR